MGSYLNIVDYADVNKQEELMVMIGMAEKAKGVLQMYKEEIKQEILEEMWDEYSHEIAKKLKGKLSPEEIAKVTGLTLKTVLLL